jgi:hypothetical protein
VPRPASITIADTRLQGPVPNHRCPACGNIDSIFRETLTFPATVDDVLSDHAIGISLWWRILFPPKRTRMRCAKCNCLFPGRWPVWARLLAWSLFCAAIAGAILSVYAHRAYLWSVVAPWCQRNPYPALAIAAVLCTAVFTVLLVVAYPRRHPAP